MFKKIILIFAIIFFFAFSEVIASDDRVKPIVQPLKIEQNYHKYKYGNLEKTFKNPANKNIENNDFSSDTGRKVLTILDILNITIFIFFIFIFIFAIYLKSKKTTLRDFLSGKSNQTKKNKFKILSAKQLENGKTVYLLEVNSKQLVVGTTNSKVDIVVPLDKSYSADDVPQEYIENLFTNNNDEFKDLEE